MIEINVPQSAEQWEKYYDLRLSDTQGRVLEVQHNTTRSQAHEGQLNLSTLPAGVYFLQMTVGDKTFSRKVIKE